jgi:TRAP-type C4-dicarboxylate transport system permease small subunit
VVEAGNDIDQIPNSIVRSLDSITKFCEDTVSVIGVLSLGSLCLLVLFGVLSRAVGLPILFVEELSGYLLVVVVFLIASESLRRGQFIRVTFFVDSLKEDTRKKMILIVDILSFIFILVVCVYSWLMIISSYQDGMRSQGMIRVPIYLTQISVVLGFSFLTMRMMIESIRKLMWLFKRIGGRKKGLKS